MNAYKIARFSALIFLCSVESILTQQVIFPGSENLLWNLVFCSPSYAGFMTGLFPKTSFIVLLLIFILTVALGCLGVLAIFSSYMGIASLLLVVTFYILILPNLALSFLLATATKGSLKSFLHQSPQLASSQS